MYIGAGIFLIVIGAIVTFAVGRDSAGGVDLQMLGWITMAGGVLAVVLSLVLERGRAVGGGFTSRKVSRTDPASGESYQEVEVEPSRR